MNAAPPEPEELDALLRLLDDETPSVREQVAQRLALCGGDISEWLATQPRILSREEKSLLTEMLSPGRREALAREWIAPTGGAAALSEDWDSVESLLRVLSDFLHDGIALRQPLADALDLLAEEAAKARRLVLGSLPVSSLMTPAVGEQEATHVFGVLHACQC
jgi:hypothetical protein